MFFLCFFFGLKIILMCFDKLIKFYAHHYYVEFWTIWYKTIYIFMNMF